MFEYEDKARTCCFTGHRPQKLHRPEEEIKRLLAEQIDQALMNEKTTFITGMAYGVDIWAGEIVASRKRINPAIRLVAAVPFHGFESRWSSEWKAAYNTLLSQADKVEYISQHFSYPAYQRRNEWMVDHSSLLIAVYSGEPGGTKNTIDYAKRNGVQLSIIKA